jgi:hypothetical protein
MKTGLDWVNHFQHWIKPAPGDDRAGPGRLLALALVLVVGAAPQGAAVGGTGQHGIAPGWQLVPPDPRSNVYPLSGGLNIALLFAKFADAPNIEIDPDDVAKVVGSVSGGGVVVPPGPVLPYRTFAQAFRDSSIQKVFFQHTKFSEVLTLPGDASEYCDSIDDSLGYPLGYNCSEGDIVRAVLEEAEDELAFDADNHQAFVILVAGYLPVGYGGRYTYQGKLRAAFVGHARERELATDHNVSTDAGPSLKSVLLHELGHAAINLAHAGIWDCYPAVVGPDALDPGDGCQISEYDDRFSPMGGGGVRDHSALEKNYANWISNSKVFYAPPGTSSVDIAAVELNAPSEYQEIRIAIDGWSTFYSIEYRRPVGNDAKPLSDYEAAFFVNGVNEGDLFDGLLVRLRRPPVQPDGDFDINAAETLLLRQLVKPGKSGAFTDPYRHITVAYTALANHRARVSVGVNVATIIP